MFSGILTAGHGGSSQQTIGFVNPAQSDHLADAGAADDLAVHHDLGMSMCLKMHLIAEFPEKFHIAAFAISKSKVFPDMDAADVAKNTRQFVYELFSGLFAKSAVEGDLQEEIHSQGLNRARFLRPGVDLHGYFVRSHYRAGMPVKGDDQAFGSSGTRFGHHLADDLLVPDVHPVKDPYGQAKSEVAFADWKRGMYGKCTEKFDAPQYKDCGKIRQDQMD